MFKNFLVKIIDIQIYKNTIIKKTKSQFLAFWLFFLFLPAGRQGTPSNR